MSDAAVTVIVPGRDVEPYAQAAIDSLRGQTRRDWRAVLIDDGSVDRTGEIFARAAVEDHRITTIRIDRAVGLGAARNRGLDVVNTPFVGFLDADDEMTPWALERTLGTLERTGSDFVIGAYTRLRPQPDGRYVEGEIQPWVRAATAPAREAVTLDEHPQATGSIVAWAKVSRRSCWRDLRFPEGRLYEDQEVAQRMLVAARAFDTIPDVLVRWRVRADGTSITQREADLAVATDCVDAMRAGLAVLAGHPAARQARQQLLRAMDLPRLQSLADQHHDPAYRALVASFAAALGHAQTNPSELGS